MADPHASVTGGVDTHKDLHVAAALDGVGRLLGTQSVPTTAAGYRALLGWLRGFGTVTSVGVEGTGSRGAGLARHLAAQGVTVLEVNRPNRQARRRRGKSDPADAEAAARAVLAREATGTPKATNGTVEAVRLLRLTRRSAMKARTQAANQIHSVIDTAPEELRAQLIVLPMSVRIPRCSRFRPGDVASPVGAAKLILASLPRRWCALDAEIETLSGRARPPLAITVAVVHHRLWDIDIVLSRSLVFGALTVGVVAIYGITVALFGELLGNRTGAPLVATALVAVGIQPAHQRVRRVVNRFVYGDRDNPASALRHLGARIGAPSDPHDVLADVAQAIGQRLRVPYVAIEELDAPVAVWGQPVPAVERVPLSHRGSDVGTLVVGTAADDRLRPADLRALTELAPHVAVVAHARRLARDLERSHQRLVATRDEERLRLRRELHDGLGPNLAALALEVDRGRRLVGRAPESAKQLLDDLSSRIRHTVGGVRAIVDDLHPPPLDGFGLVRAVEELAGRFAGELRVMIEAAPGLPPMPAAVELAAYRIAAEAITNAARHAAGSTCHVAFAAGDDLELRVIDDGCGLASDAAEGVGLPSMRHRATELGGSCSVTSSPNGGTEVLVRLPLLDRNGHADS